MLPKQDKRLALSKASGFSQEAVNFWKLHPREVELTEFRKCIYAQQINGEMLYF